jgi:hypothetical protein
MPTLTKGIRIPMTPELYSTVRRAAKEADVTMAEVGRTALQRFVDALPDDTPAGGGDPTEPTDA